MNDIEALTPEELEELAWAKKTLLSPDLTGRMGDVIGRPLENGLNMLPKRWRDIVDKATEAALYKGLEFALSTMGKHEVGPARNRLHKVVVAGSGIAAGVAGLYALAVELPFSTCVMLRSIADIARSEGHDIDLLETRLACLQVFALGGGGPSDGSETGYWAARVGLAATMAEAARHITKSGVIKKSAPPVMNFIAAVAARFGGVVGAQATALAVPVIGAASGGVINYLFMNHFQNVARAHFIIRRLERKHGLAVIRSTFECLEI